MKAKGIEKANTDEQKCFSVFAFSHIRYFLEMLIRLHHHQSREVMNMGSMKLLTLDRYEHGLLIRARYEEWQRMQAEEKPTEDIEDLILKVIDAPAKKQLGRKCK